MIFGLCFNGQIDYHHSHCYFIYPMKEIPDFSPEFQRYAELVPEFQIPVSKRATDTLKRLAYDEKGGVLPENEIRRNILIFIECVRAKVAQLESNPLWQTNLHEVITGSVATTVASTDKEFQNSPRTNLKLFQEILTSPTERVAFDPRLQPSGQNRVSARDIVIDPSIITKTVLENLGLEEFIAAPRTHQEEKVQLKARAIPAIKEMLQSLEPFTLSHETDRSKLRYFRLFRIGAGSNLGKVLGTQMIDNHKVLFLTDLHGGYRRIDLIHEQYSEEIATLQEIQQTVRDVDFRLSKEWQQTKDPEKLAEVKAKLNGLVDKLRFVTNEHKQKMRDQIEAAATLESVYTIPALERRDRDGAYRVVQPAKTIVRLNPGATRARINTTPLHVGRRIQEIASIKRFLAVDQTRMQSYIEAQTLPFAEFHKTVRELHDKFKIYQLEKPMSAQDRARAIANLGILKHSCSASTTPIMMFEPYRTFAALMVQHIEKTVESLRKEEAPEARQEAAAEFTGIYLLTKVQRFYTDLQAVYARYLSGGKMPNYHELNALNARVSAMHRELSTRDVATKITTAPMDRVFIELYHLSNSIRSRARKAMQGLDSGLSEEEIRPIILEIYDRIKGFDFVELMRG